MNTTTARSRGHGAPSVTTFGSPQRRVAGFTIVEVLVAVTISSILISSILASFLGLSRGVKSVGAYSEMSGSSRNTLAILGSDLRAAQSVTLATATTLNFTLPAAAPHNGHTLEYTYDALLDTLSRVERDSGGNLVSSRILLDGVDQFVFSYFNASGGSLGVGTPSLLLSVKSVRMEASLRRQIIGDKDISYTISGLYSMRNGFLNP